MQYLYVGESDPERERFDRVARALIREPADVSRWIAETQQAIGAERTVTTTFIVDLGGNLWIADRHSEHVVCARGQDVLTAGEIVFTLDKTAIRATAISNQSTGYCPEPESWPALAAALDRAGIPHPGGFTTSYLFRRCDSCGTTNLIKDGWFECGVCQAPLSAVWNCG